MLLLSLVSFGIALISDSLWAATASTVQNEAHQLKTCMRHRRGALAGSPPRQGEARTAAACASVGCP
jgi:hypothetical protein